MKPTKVKVWPELVDFLPALPDLIDSRRETVSGHAPVEVDFGSVRVMSATGVTVFLLQLLRLLGRGRTAEVRHGWSTEVRSDLFRLGAFDVLPFLAEGAQGDLYSGNPHLIQSYTRSSRIVSLPVQRLSFGATSDRREGVRQFVTRLTTVLYDLPLKSYSNVNGLVMLLNEIAKNTADHTTADALFGIDVIATDAATARLTFAFGDLGVGIKQHIEANLPPEDAHRQRKMSLYEAYRLAVLPGYTSNRLSSVNRGHGMSIIIDIASGLGMHLSVFDAWSRGLLSSIPDVQSPTHAAIRRIFHNIGHEVGFFYYGDLFITADEQ